MKTAFIIILIHYIADFVLQDENWAINKSKSFGALISHTAIYSSFWVLPIIFLFPDNWSWQNYVINAWLFAFITFICHTAIDYVTSKITSKLHKEGKFGSPIPNFGFFSVIGFDQVLHYAHLFITFEILSNITWF